MHISSIDFSKDNFPTNGNIPVKIKNFLSEWFNDSKTIEIQSSGTTSKPKIYTVEKNILKESAKLTQQYFGYKKGDKALLALSPDFIAGKMLLIRAIESQLHLTINPPNNLESLNQNENFDFCPLVPLQVEKYFNKLTQIKNVLIGGAPLNESLEEKIKELPNSFYQSFGMTETYSHFAIRNIKKESDFKLLKGVTAEISIENTLIVSIPKLKVFKLTTNDVVDIKENKFTWLGRADNTINSGGIKIQPELIEKKIRENGTITNSFIISSIKSTKLGEELLLIVEGESSKLKKDNFRYLSKYKQPKRIIHIKQFSRTEVSSKIKRKDIDKNLHPNNIISQYTL